MRIHSLQILLMNPFLQKEIHSYILRTEGASAADSFMRIVQQYNSSAHHQGDDPATPTEELGQSHTHTRTPLTHTHTRIHTNATSRAHTLCHRNTRNTHGLARTHRVALFKMSLQGTQQVLSCWFARVLVFQLSR